jgi:hypothetical protein
MYFIVSINLTINTSIVFEGGPMIYALTYYKIPKDLSKDGFDVDKVADIFSLKRGKQPTEPLTNLVGGPEHTLDYYCVRVDTFTSLEGSPKRVHGNFHCHINKQLMSLKGAENTVVDFNFACSDTSIKTLEFCPRHIGNQLICHNTKLTDLRNVHKHVLYIKGIFLSSSNIKSHVLGLVLIDSLVDIEHLPRVQQQSQWMHIINTHLKTDRDVYLCQDNLIKAGFAEFAQL